MIWTLIMSWDTFIRVNTFLTITFETNTTSTLITTNSITAIRVVIAAMSVLSTLINVITVFAFSGFIEITYTLDYGKYYEMPKEQVKYIFFT